MYGYNWGTNNNIDHHHIQFEIRGHGQHPNLKMDMVAVGEGAGEEEEEAEEDIIWKQNHAKFIHSFFLSQQIPLNFCTEHASYTAVFCAKFQNYYNFVRLTLKAGFQWDCLHFMDPWVWTDMHYLQWYQVFWCPAILLTSRYQYFISDVSFTSKLAFQYFDDNCIIHASRIWSSLIHWNLLIIIMILNIIRTANQQISNLIFLVEQDKFRGRFFVGKQFFLVNYQVLCNKMNNSWLLLMILIQFTDARTCKFVHLCMHWNWKLWIDWFLLIIINLTVISAHLNLQGMAGINQFDPILCFCQTLWGKIMACFLMYFFV